MWPGGEGLRMEESAMILTYCLIAFPTEFSSGFFFSAMFFSADSALICPFLKLYSSFAAFLSPQQSWSYFIQLGEKNHAIDA